MAAHKDLKNALLSVIGQYWALKILGIFVLIFWPILVFSDLEFDRVKFTDEWLKSSISLLFISIAVKFYSYSKKLSEIRNLFERLKSCQNRFVDYLAENEDSFDNITFEYNLLYRAFTNFNESNYGGTFKLNDEESKKIELISQNHSSILKQVNKLKISYDKVEKEQFVKSIIDKVPRL